MMKEKQLPELVDIPDYAKVNKRGDYYALKRNLPYFSDPNAKGILVIGHPSETPGKMVPDWWNYPRHCTQTAAEKRKAEKQIRSGQVRQRGHGKEHRGRRCGAGKIEHCITRFTGMPSDILRHSHIQFRSPECSFLLGR